MIKYRKVRGHFKIKQRTGVFSKILTKLFGPKKVYIPSRYKICRVEDEV